METSLWEECEAIREKYGVVLGIWTKKDAENAILEITDSSGNAVFEENAAEVTDAIWQQELRERIDTFANDPSLFFNDIVQMALREYIENSTK